MFENTEISFQSKTDRDLKKSIKLFKLLKRNSLVKIGKVLLNIAIFLKFRLTQLLKNFFLNNFAEEKILMNVIT